MRRPHVFLLLMSVAVPLIAGCARATQAKDLILAAIDRTEQQAREFTYTDKAGGYKTTVDGSIEDDLRYRAYAARDGKPVASLVVFDDARALQVADVGAPSALHSAATTTTATVPEALRSGQWVLDRHGASKLVSGSVSQQVGQDPIFDSLTTLEYVRAAAGTAFAVQRFNPESETYRPKLDPFPRPSAGILRYDLVPPVLTPRQSNTGLQRDIPDTAFFRLMAVYLRDGIVVEVREHIDIETRLNDPQSNLEARIQDYMKNPPSAINQQAVTLLQVLNQQLSRTGKPPIRLRDMDLRFTALGHAARVVLPQGASEASLAAVGDHGQVLYERH